MDWTIKTTDSAPRMSQSAVDFTGTREAAIEATRTQHKDTGRTVGLYEFHSPWCWMLFQGGNVTINRFVSTAHNE